MCSKIIRSVWLLTRGEVEGRRAPCVDARGIQGPHGTGVGRDGGKVGVHVGPGEGGGVGKGVGKGVGGGLGSATQHPVFRAVGTRDGAALGALVGPGVGPGVGPSVGPTVGETVGARVGSYSRSVDAATVSRLYEKDLNAAARPAQSRKTRRIVDEMASCVHSFGCFAVARVSLAS